MESNVEKTLNKLEFYQSKLGDLNAKYRHAAQLKEAARWIAVASGAIIAVKFIPGVSYHAVGVTLTGIATLAGLLALAIWVEQRGKVTTLIKESWSVSKTAGDDGVNLGTDGRILRDDLGRPINPFAPDKRRT